jgi:hypothetical protein
VTFHSSDDVVVVGFLEAALAGRSEEVALLWALLLELPDPVAQRSHAQTKLRGKLPLSDRPMAGRVILL